VLGGCQKTGGWYVHGRLIYDCRVVVRGLHIRKKGLRDFAQRSTESRCYIRPP